MFFMIITNNAQDEEIVNHAFDTRDDAMRAFDMMKSLDWVVDATIIVEEGDARIATFNTVDEMRIRPDEV